MGGWPSPLILAGTTTSEGAPRYALDKYSLLSRGTPFPGCVGEFKRLGHPSCS